MKAGMEAGMEAGFPARDVRWWAASEIGRVQRMSRYVRRFGPVTATRLLRSTLRPYGRLAAVYPPGAKRPLWLRTGTADIFTFEKIFVEGEYDVMLPRRISTIVDGGANIGCASVFFAMQYPAASIIAVEPDPLNYVLLKQNCQGYDNITTVHAGLWNQPADLLIDNPDRGADSSRVIASRSAHARTIRGISVLDILSQHQLTRIDLLKLDIETSEIELFSRGSHDWLDRVGVIMIELHDRLRPGCSAAFYAAISRFSFLRENRGEVVVIVLGAEASV
jgi:FkbM family methyltransferase